MIELHGWVANRRSSGKIGFLQLRDGTGVIQCVVMADRVNPEVFELADHVPYESSVIVTGQVQKIRDPLSVLKSLSTILSLSQRRTPTPSPIKIMGLRS